MFRESSFRSVAELLDIDDCGTCLLQFWHQWPWFGFSLEAHSLLIHPTLPLRCLTNKAHGETGCYELPVLISCTQYRLRIATKKTALVSTYCVDRFVDCWSTSLPPYGRMLPTVTKRTRALQHYDAKVSTLNWYFSLDDLFSACEWTKDEVFQGILLFVIYM